MAENSQPTVQQLFKDWRNGNAEAGQTMAQLFTDWYYAITAVRLGDHKGRPPLEAACNAFTEGIMSVSRPSELINWAHELVGKELETVGGRIKGGDFPNALTNHRSPTMLLRDVAEGLPPSQRKLLSQAYDQATPRDVLIAEAEAHGGWPFALLDARYTLKRLLHTRAAVGFTEVPESPNLDLAPLPLYEAGCMTSREEEIIFEKWLITNSSLCRDVAEFATFAHALQAGAYKGELPEKESRTAPSAPDNKVTAPVDDAADDRPAPVPAPFKTVEDPSSKMSTHAMIFLAVGCILLLLIIFFVASG